jgi:hypothetical protein
MDKTMSPAQAQQSHFPMSQAVSAQDMPTSFGVFKPVGWLMVGLPTQDQANAVVATLHNSGWHSTRVLHFTPNETIAELQGLIENAGPLAGFGYEITLLRRYLELARMGYRWLLVKVDDTEQAAAAAELAGAGGATLAVRYRSLTVDELL